jgi:hypothetical protein
MDWHFSAYMDSRMMVMKEYVYSITAMDLYTPYQSNIKHTADAITLHQ